MQFAGRLTPSTKIVIRLLIIVTLSTIYDLIYNFLAFRLLRFRFVSLPCSRVNANSYSILLKPLCFLFYILFFSVLAYNWYFAIIIIIIIITALQPLALAVFSVSSSYTQSVGLLGLGISPSQGRYLHTRQHKHRIKAHRHPCLEWDSHPRSRRSSKRRQLMP
jgi:hypothetical protein